MPDSKQPLPLDYASPESRLAEHRHPIVGGACIGLGALFCGVGIPCMFADDFNPENMPTDIGIIVFGTFLCVIGLRLKGRPRTPDR